MKWIQHVNTKQTKQMKDHIARKFLKSPSWVEIGFDKKGKPFVVAVETPKKK